MDDNYYETFCKPRMDRHDDKIYELMIVVKNGLSHRMIRIERMIWFIGTVVVGKIVADLFL